MLYAFPEKNRRIVKTERLNGSLKMYSDAGVQLLTPISSRSVRIRYSLTDSFSESEKPMLVDHPTFDDWKFTESDGEIVLSTADTVISIDRETSSYKYYDNNGKLLLRDNAKEPRILDPFEKYLLSPEGSQTDKIKTADGEKTVIREAAKISDGTSYHSTIKFEWQEGESLYGFGQHEEGFGDLRGKHIYCHQANRKVAMPLMCSNFGYGILLDCYSPFIFCDNEYGSYIYCEAVPEIDWFFINGGSIDGVIKQYRYLTGKAAMLPKWAFGYIQSQERYETQEEILRAAEEYRSRNIGLDCIVLDWESWEPGKWGQKTFDLNRFPDAKNMTDELHKNHVRFMISIWPSLNESTDNRREFDEAGLMLPSCEFYNCLSVAGRKLYWKQANEGLFSKGIDAWWCDNCEPFTPEWTPRFRLDPGRAYEQFTSEAGLRIGAEYSNSYALYHARGMYEGQRSVSDKRVVNLIRSSYAGQQRYSTIVWSGDTEATWQTYKRQIAAGLGFCASGHPYWTLDIGAFFVKRGSMWYWKGDYPDTANDLGYRELYTRWYQFGAFLPVFRAHGTDCRREVWNFGDEGDQFYDVLVKYNKIRYSLMPYIYSLAGRAWLDDESMIRLLACDWPSDPTACKIADQYMFGDSLMICPVTEPMYYGRNSEPLVSEKTRRVYLPEGGWYHFGSDEYFDGCCWIDAKAPLNDMPVYVRAGSIIPISEPALSTDEQSGRFTLKVYSGADGRFKFYDDAGDGYGFENGEYVTAEIIWHDAEKKLDIPENIRNRVGLVEIV